MLVLSETERDRAITALRSLEVDWEAKGSVIAVAEAKRIRASLEDTLTPAVNNHDLVRIQLALSRSKEYDTVVALAERLNVQNHAAE